MAKSVTYFVAGSTPGIEYESTIALIVNTHSMKSGHGELLLPSQQEVMDMQLSHGMSDEFYKKTSRLFRVTVEEVLPEDREDLLVLKARKENKQ